MSNLLKSSNYLKWISSLKQRFQKAQIKAAVKVNSTLLEFYWELGADIVEKQKNAAWGSGFLKQLSKDLMAEFPDVKGFALRNINYIRKWYLFYNKENIKVQQLVAQLPESLPLDMADSNVEQIVPHLQSAPNLGTSCYPIENIFNPQPLFQIPWGQNIVIISKSKTVKEALFYVQSTVKYGWSRSILSLQIKSDLYKREGKAITNFEQQLPAVDSDLAQQLLKDPYNFEFVTLTKGFKERELENALLAHTEKFLLELGVGFAFVGRQYQLNFSDKELFLDLLFYHLELRCFVVIDLKAGEFKPEYAGKMNFYCNVVDELLRKDGDAATIGMILCQEKDKLFVEYSLKKMDTPIGVSEYEITESLPDNLKSALPTVEEIELELLRDIAEDNNE